MDVSLLGRKEITSKSNKNNDECKIYYDNDKTDLIQVSAPICVQE